jgi:uncharacterized protein (DUF2132 family)
MTPPQPRNPLHGITLAAMVDDLVAFFGWEELGRRIPIRCFTSDPSVSSSLKFLRKTPWAREKVEGLYLFVQRERRRRGLVARGPHATSSPSERDRDQPVGPDDGPEDERADDERADDADGSPDAG